MQLPRRARRWLRGKPVHSQPQRGQARASRPHPSQRTGPVAPSDAPLQARDPPQRGDGLGCTMSPITSVAPSTFRWGLAVARRAGGEKAVLWASTVGAGAHSLAPLQAAGADRLRGKLLIDVCNPIDEGSGFPPTLTVSNDDVRR